MLDQLREAPLARSSVEAVVTVGSRRKHIGSAGVRTKRSRSCHLNEPSTCQAGAWGSSPASQPYVAGALRSPSRGSDDRSASIRLNEIGRASCRERV